MHLTESMAMMPGASVSGLYFWHPDARYFGLGRIGSDQLTDYAARKGWSLAEADRWHDALEWREMGGYLPGWAVPQPANEDPFVPGEEHEALFRQWRGTRIAAAA